MLPHLDEIPDGQQRNARKPGGSIPRELQSVHRDPHQAGSSYMGEYWLFRRNPLSQMPLMTLPSEMRETSKRKSETGLLGQPKRVTAYGRGESLVESANEPAPHRSPGTPSYRHDTESGKR